MSECDCVCVWGGGSVASLFTVQIASMLLCALLRIDNTLCWGVHHFTAHRLLLSFSKHGDYLVYSYIRLFNNLHMVCNNLLMAFSA